MSIIDQFYEENPSGKSSWRKKNVLSLICFASLYQTPKVIFFHMVACEHPEVIEDRRRLIDTEILGPDEADDDGYIDDGGDASDEEDESGLVEVGVRKGVNEVEKKGVEDVQQAVKHSSISYYKLKTNSLLTHEFK